MAYREIYRDSDKTIERDTVTGAERYTWANPNEDAIRKAAATALETNRTFLAVASPTNAQTLAQVKALTRQNQGVIRLALNMLDGTD